MKVTTFFLMKKPEHEEIDIPDGETDMIRWQAEALHQLKEKYPDYLIELTAFEMGGVFIGLANDQNILQDGEGHDCSEGA
jgi:hypothetical protein